MRTAINFNRRLPIAKIARQIIERNFNVGDTFCAKDIFYLAEAEEFDSEKSEEKVIMNISACLANLQTKGFLKFSHTAESRTARTKQKVSHYELINKDFEIRDHSRPQSHSKSRKFKRERRKEFESGLKENVEVLPERRIISIDERAALIRQMSRLKEALIEIASDLETIEQQLKGE